MKPVSVQVRRAAIRLIFLAILLPVILLSLGSATQVGQAAVELLYFVAEPGDRKVNLRWKTATELNTLGFFVQRSTQRDGSYARVNQPIILAEGDDLTGSEYEYLDQDSALINGSQYWYILEEIDSSQNSSLTTPIAALVGLTLTPTPTATLTLAVTQSASPIASGTATLTAPPAGTNANLPTQTVPATRPAGSEPTAAATPGALPQTMPTAYPPLQQPGGPPDSVIVGADAAFQGPTATLVPFPTVTILFPEATAAPLPDFSNLPGYGDGFDWQEIFDLWPLGMIILAWIILGAWFFISQRHT